MFIVQVHVLVKENMIQDFIDATKENAKSSILEPGIFEVIHAFLTKIQRRGR